MNRQEAETIITEYLKPIFGFALKRCKNAHDAEDLLQEIVLKAFCSLLYKDSIEDARKYIWTIAHNSLSNYYRTAARSVVGIPIEEAAETIAAPDLFSEQDEDAEMISRLQSEIAYLSKLQRKIVIAYYFENRRQADIAKALDIPLGTVKWHLFEAKKELKRGMDTMRKASDLKFNPIKFHSYGISGSVGTNGINTFFRSALSQNICYCVRKEAKAISEIADALGVSPVYIESEIDFLETYGFLKKQKERYIANFIISEPTAELLTLQDAMYKKAADLFANALYDALIASGLLEHPDILCGQKTQPAVSADRNFLLWSLIPYIASESGKQQMEHTIPFEEAATIRPDGAQNICYASVIPDTIALPEGYVHMTNWCGPFRHSNAGTPSGTSFWQIDTEWSEKRIELSKAYEKTVDRILSLEKRECEEGMLSRDDYAWLSEHGYVKTNGKDDSDFRSSWQIVILASKEIKNRLLAIGEKIKRNCQAEFDALKAPYMKAMLDSVPAHLRKVKAYELQFIFHADGWFLLHCLTALLHNGKLKPPTEEQRKVLTTLMIQD